MTSKQLDKSRPYATIHGDVESDAAFEQDGKQFNTLGKEIGAVPGFKQPEAGEKEPKEGEGNLAHGQIPDFNKPIEEGGGGGGMTKSYPQTTTDGQKVIDEHSEKVDPEHKTTAIPAGKKK